MLALLYRLEQKSRLPRGKMLRGTDYHLIGIFAILGGFLLLPASPVGVSAGIPPIVLGFVCLFTIILAPVGCFLMQVCIGITVRAHCDDSRRLWDFGFLPAPQPQMVTEHR